MHVILSDVSLAKLNPLKYTAVFDPSAIPVSSPCMGCFSCWLKTPESCIFQDQVSAFTKALKQSDTLYILTQNCYGCYSPFVKCAIDRSLSYVQPYFTLRKGKMHHVVFPDRSLRLIVIAYGSEKIKEQKDLHSLVQANAINMNAAALECYHCRDEQEAMICLQRMKGGTAI